MRRLVTVMAVAALVAACGGSGKSTSVSPSAPSTPSSRPSATTATNHVKSAPSNASNHAKPYPAAVRKKFMALCLRRGRRSACDCALSYLEQNIPFARLKAAPYSKLVAWEIKAAGYCSTA